jgi:hypothetical protein
VLFHVFHDEWQDVISASHDASPEYDHLRVVGVNQRNSVSRPYVQTMLPDFTGNGIFVTGCGEERLKIDLRYAGQAGFVESRCLSYYPRQ